MKDEFSIEKFEHDFDEIKGQAERIFKSGTKLEQKIREQGVKYRKNLRQFVMEMDKGASELHAYYTKITTDENEAKKAAKKGKMFANSVKALGVYLEHARTSLDSLKPLLEDIDDSSWTYDELKKWTRSVARLLEKIDKERAAADKIMGIDFMIKKRKLNRPLSQALKQVNQLKDFLQKDYMLIKHRDDVISLLEQMRAELQQLEDYHDGHVSLLSQKSSLEKEIHDVESEIKNLQSSSFMKELQNLKIALKKKELEISGKFNPYKKVFGHLVSSSRKGDVSISFELVGIARDYHDNPLEAFLKENDEFTRIMTLARKLLSMTEHHSKLKIRGKEKNRLEGLLNINKVKLQELKEEYLALQGKISEMLSDPQLKVLNDQISSLEEKKRNLSSQVAQLEEELQILESKMRDLMNALEEKHARVNQLLSVISSFQPEHVK